MLNSIPTVFYEYYFYITIAIALIILVIYRRRDASVPSFEFSKQDIWILGFIVVFSLVLKTYYFSLIPFWGDEISQFTTANASGAVMGAALQQQPPIGYFLTLWFVQLLGYSEFAIRAPVIFFSTFVLVLFYLLIRRIGVAVPSAIIAVILYSLNPLVFQYSIEARPVIFGCVVSFWFLYELWTNFFYNDQKPIHQILRVAAIAFILLNTVGFQPVVFLISVACLFFIGFFFSRSFISGFFGIILSFLVFLPIELNIINQSRYYLGIVSPKKIVSDDLAEHFQFQLFLIGLVLVLTLFVLIFLKFKMKLRLKLTFESFPKKLKLVIWLFFLNSLFSSLALAIFYFFINYKLNTRYLLIGFTPMFVGIALLLENAFEIIKNHQRFKKWAYALPPLVAVGFYFTFFFPLYRPNHYKWRTQTTNAVKYLINNVNSDENVIVSCLYVPIGCWDYEMLIDHFRNLGQQINENVASPTRSTVKKILGRKKIDSIYWLVQGPEIPIKKNSLNPETVWSQDSTNIVKLEKEKKWDQLEAYVDNYRGVTLPKNFQNMVSYADLILELKNGHEAEVLKSWHFNIENKDIRDLKSALLSGP